MKTLANLLSDESVKNHIMQLYTEYSSHTSKEARYVKCLDLFDMYLQAYEYELLNNADLSEFFSNVPKHLCDTSDFDPQIRAWLKELMRIRADKLNILSKDSNLNTILRNFLKI